MTCQLTAVHQQGTKCPNGGFGSPDNAVKGFLVLVSLKGRLKSPPWNGKNQPSSYRLLVVQATPVQNWGFIFPKYFRGQNIWYLKPPPNNVWYISLDSNPPFLKCGSVWRSSSPTRLSCESPAAMKSWLIAVHLVHESTLPVFSIEGRTTNLPIILSYFILTTGYVWISSSIYSCRSRSIYHFHLLKFFKRQAHANLRKMMCIYIYIFIYIEIWFAQCDGPKSDLAISSRGWLWNYYLCAT